MNDETEKPSEEISSVTIEEELKVWPESTYAAVAQATEQGRKIRNTETHRRYWLSGAFALLLGGIALIGYLFYYKSGTLEAVQPYNSINRQAESNSTSISVPTSMENLQNSQLDVGGTNNRENFSETESIVKSEGNEILKVIKYEFYAGKFIRNNTALKDVQNLILTLKGLDKKLNDSWIIIFASASLEGNKDYNLDLCQRRIYAVKAMLQNDVGVSSRGYWGILAGEYKFDFNAPLGQEEEEEEERLAAEKGEKWLSEQRKLIIITIQETKPLEPKAKEQVAKIVAKHTYEKGILPAPYDAPNSEPFGLK